MFAQLGKAVAYHPLSLKERVLPMTVMVEPSFHPSDTGHTGSASQHQDERRVLHIKTLWMKAGGIEQQILGIIQGATDTRMFHQVAQLVPNVPSHYGWDLVQSDVLTETSVGKDRLHPVVWDRMAFLIPTLRKLRTLIARHNIDLLHAHDNRSNFVGAILARWCNLPLVVSLYGYVRTSWKLRVLASLDHQILRTADHIIASSPSMMRWIPLTCSSRVTTILNAIETMPYRMSFSERTLLIRELGLDGQRPIVSLVGRLSEEKGHHVLLAAVPNVLRRFPLTQFVFAGDGPLREVLERQIEQAGLTPSVRLVGFVDNARAVMALSDLVVQPSLTESLPLTILEAMTQGKAIVATDVGSIREAVVEGETGLLVPPHDPAALAKAIIAMLENDHRRTAMGERGARLVRDRFSIATRVSQIHDVYQRVFAGQHSAQIPEWVGQR